MDSIKKRLKGIITRECIAKGIALQHINLGCSHAEYLVEQGEAVAYAVREGMAVASGQQKLANYRRRSTLLHVA